MRLFLVPLLVYAFVPLDQSGEPTERAMRIAFERTLQMQVDNALEFIAETGGPGAVARVREAGTDRFQVRTFKKIDCAPEDGGHRCNFEIDVSVVNGMIAQKVQGRFQTGQDHRLAFVQDI